ncbi:MAG: FeoB-associated Cys-rich membrane protein [Lachnospiraceae bacterium]|nr:FeoB-associated Cys-rich membrane protein [Lachnospiraceae bacterium]
MFTWIMENMATIIISTVLLIIVAAIIVRMVYNRKKGRSSCGCGCAGCAMNGSCHPQK